MQDMVDTWQRVLGQEATAAAAKGPRPISSFASALGSGASASAGTSPRAHSSADIGPAGLWALARYGSSAAPCAPVAYQTRAPFTEGVRERLREGEGCIGLVGGGGIPGDCAVASRSLPPSGLGPRLGTGADPCTSASVHPYARERAGAITTGRGELTPCARFPTGRTPGALQWKGQVAGALQGPACALREGEGESKEGEEREGESREGGGEVEGVEKGGERDSEGVEIFFFPDLDRTGGSRRRHRRHTAAWGDVSEYNCKGDSSPNAGFRGGLCTPYSGGANVNAVRSASGGSAGGSGCTVRENALEWESKGPFYRDPFPRDTSTEAPFKTSSKDHSLSSPCMPRLQSLGFEDGHIPALPRGPSRFGPIAKSHSSASTSNSPIRSLLKTSKRQRSLDYVESSSSSLDKSKSPRSPAVRKVRFNNVVTVYAVVRSASET